MLEGSEKCDDNWLKKIEIGENDSICTVTPYLYYGNSVVLLGTDSVGYGITLIVYPTAFLKSSVSITDAAGTQDDPFVVS